MAKSRQLRAFGANLRRERILRGLTQERMAELAELNIRTIQKIEAGELDLLMTTVLRIHKPLGCAWEKLLGRNR